MYIKSRVSPGPNASNVLLKIVATRHCNRLLNDHSIEDNLNQREIYHVGNDQHDAEFWGPISREIPIGNFQNYNL